MIKYFIGLVNVYIYNLPIEEFMRNNPPCKECLIQSMCLEYTANYIFMDSVKVTPNPRLLIKGTVCKELRKFIEKNKLFESVI